MLVCTRQHNHANLKASHAEISWQEFVIQEYKLHSAIIKSVQVLRLKVVHRVLTELLLILEIEETCCHFLDFSALKVTGEGKTSFST